MKSTILNIKKRVLVVDVNDIVSTAENIKIEYGILKYDVERYLDGNSNVWICNKKEFSGTFKFICKGSELSEEIAKEIVNTVDVAVSGKFIMQKYSNYKDIRAFYCGTALDSFISAIEANGHYWAKNPLGDEPRSYSEVVDGVSADELMDDLREWNEAESRTFKPEQVILFEIL